MRKLLRDVGTHYGTHGALAYGAARFGHPPEKAATLYDQAPGPTNVGGEVTTDIATLAMARGGNFDEVYATFQEIARWEEVETPAGLTEHDTAIALTSGALLTDQNHTRDMYRYLDNKLSLNERLATGILTLAALVQNNPDTVLKTHQEARRHRFPAFFSDSQKATITLAASLDTVDTPGVHQMFDYAMTADGMHKQTATNLTLTTTSQNADYTFLTAEEIPIAIAKK